MAEYVNIKFIKPGMLTSIHDEGRPDFREYGIPEGGALDKLAAYRANTLVGNNPGNPVLEITLLGPEMYFDSACQIAITGGNISPTLNGVELIMNETIDVPTNSVLKFGKLKSGCRAYMAVAGEWQVEKWLGSSSPILFSAFNILPNNLMKKGSLIIIKKSPKIKYQKWAEGDVSLINDMNRVRVLPGPEFNEFPPFFVGYFFSHPHRITPDSNRMGYRLENKIEFTPPYEMISSPVVPGTIQITNSGQPIILMADAQTTGGYFRLANILSEDLNKLAQLKPGDEIWFSLETI